MALRTFSAAPLIIVGVAIGAAVGSNDVWADNFHPGKVVERGSDAPVSAEVKAWKAAPRSGESNDCPEFGEAPLDRQTSDPSSGEFGMKIANEVDLYNVVYCANGYHKKVDEHLPNDFDGEPIIPLPARLRKQSDDADIEEENAALGIDTIRTVVFALNELAYLYDINPEVFLSSLEQYRNLVSQQDGSAGEVVGSLSELIPQWASQ